MKQAEQLGIGEQFIEMDANKEMNISGIQTVWSNILYWLDDPIKVLTGLNDKLPSGSKLVVVFPNNDFLQYCRSYERNSKLWTLLNRGRRDTLMWTLDMKEFESALKRETDFEIERATRYLSERTLQIWDVGLRPLSPYLVKMANNLTPELRLEIKHEWCEGMRPFALELLEHELAHGEREGGYNFVVMRKT